MSVMWSSDNVDDAHDDDRKERERERERDREENRQVGWLQNYRFSTVWKSEVKNEYHLCI
jgi:hypothetical protein